MQLPAAYLVGLVSELVQMKVLRSESTCGDRAFCSLLLDRGWLDERDWLDAEFIESFVESRSEVVLLERAFAR